MPFEANNTMIYIRNITIRTVKSAPYLGNVGQDDQIWLNFVNTWVTLKRIEGFFAGLDRKWLGQS